MSFADRRCCTWRRQGERYAPPCVIQCDRYGDGGGNVHVWDAFPYAGCMQLYVLRRNVTAKVYIDEVLRELVTPFFQRNFKIHGVIFQQDNARLQTAKKKDKTFSH